MIWLRRSWLTKTLLYFWDKRKSKVLGQSLLKLSANTLDLVLMYVRVRVESLMAI